MTAKIYSFRAKAPLFSQWGVVCCGTSGPENGLGNVPLGANRRINSLEVERARKSQS